MLMTITTGIIKAGLPQAQAALYTRLLELEVMPRSFGEGQGRIRSLDYNLSVRIQETNKSNT